VDDIQGLTSMINIKGYMKGREKPWLGEKEDFLANETGCNRKELEKMIENAQRVPCHVPNQKDPNFNESGRNNRATNPPQPQHCAAQLAFSAVRQPSERLPPLFINPSSNIQKPSFYFPSMYRIALNDLTSPLRHQ
jgi:hypothetical protein